jgi:hypothetical protein
MASAWSASLIRSGAALQGLLDRRFTHGRRGRATPGPITPAGGRCRALRGAATRSRTPLSRPTGHGTTDRLGGRDSLRTSLLPTRRGHAPLAARAEGVVSARRRTSRAGLPTDHPVQAAVQMQFDRVMQLVDARLREAPYFAGSEFTAADIMSVFSLTTMQLFQPVNLRSYPGILTYLQRIGERPAYRPAMAKGDPDLVPMLD